jgi:membrane-bound metal-dependent hydrolase YbcI (DUF457 family)
MVEMNTMPSPVGHALGGIAVAWAADLFPGRPPSRAASPDAPFYDRAGGGVTILCAGLAMAPDADLILVTHRTVTHSIGAVAVVMIVAAAVTGWVTRRRPVPLGWMTLTCGAAYAGHLVLDWLAVDRTPPFGLQIFWPVSRGWFISGIDLFAQTERRDLLSLASLHTNLLAISQEVAILLPLLALLWLVRVKTLARLAAESSRGHHPAEKRARPVL